MEDSLMVCFLVHVPQCLIRLTVLVLDEFVYVLNHVALATSLSSQD